MTRSRRKTPVCGITTAESEKADKALTHRLMRRKVAVALREDEDESTPPEANREALNPYSMAKDGKQRFDPAKHPRLMRK